MIGLASTATCTLGAFSVPLVATLTASPFKDVSVEIKVKTYDAVKKEENPSVGLTPPTNKVTFTTSNSEGVF